MKRIPSNYKEEILSLVNVGYKPTQIANILNLNPVSVGCQLRMLGYKFHPDKGNIHYFDNIDSNAKAYVTGFIAADGSLVKSSSTNLLLTITVKHTDRDILEFIKSEIGNSHKIQTIKRESSYDKSKQIHHVRYTISDKHLSSALLKIGITPNKSLTMPNIILNIPKKFRKAFIIGYFDGDGSVSLPKGNTKFSPRKQQYVTYPSHLITLNIRGTKEFLQGIVDELELTRYRICQYDAIPTLYVWRKDSIVKFFKCYEGLNFFLKRKYNKFLERIHHPSYEL